MLVIEHAMDRIAWATRPRPARRAHANLYAPGRDLTPYGMAVEDTDTLLDVMRRSSGRRDYRARRAADRCFQRGLARS